MIPRLLQAFWRFRYLGKSCGVGFGIQYYTKKYIIPKQNQLSRPLERKIMLPLQLKKKTNHILWI